MRAAMPSHWISMTNSPARFARKARSSDTRCLRPIPSGCSNGPGTITWPEGTSISSEFVIEIQCEGITALIGGEHQASDHDDRILAGQRPGDNVIAFFQQIESGGFLIPHTGFSWRLPTAIVMAH